MSKLNNQSEWIFVRNSRIHNRGIFASKLIPKGTRVIEYVGKKITKKQAEKIGEEQVKRGNSKEFQEGHVYIFELNKKYDLDGNVLWNTARLINHSCNPNCETEMEDHRIWIVAMRDIKKGEEITYNYGYDIIDFEKHPCRCNSKNCVGYIVKENQWPKLKKFLNQRKTIKLN